MKSIYKRDRSPDLKYILFHIILILNPAHACSFRSAGERAAQNIRDGLNESSARISNSLQASTHQLTSTINSAVGRLENLANTVVKEVGATVRQASKDLKDVGMKLANSVDKGIEQLSNVMKEAIDASKQITDRLAKSLDKAVEEIGKQIENAVNNIREVIETLSKTVDKAVEELGTTLRYMADQFLEAAKQVEVKINSGDLVDVAKETKEGLIQSVDALSKNWKLAVNTADFKDLGQGAAAELSKALQNMHGRFEAEIEIGDNMRRAILYISVSAGIAFSVCFVAIIISLKSCRSCVVSIWQAATNRSNPGEGGGENRNSQRSQPERKQGNDSPNNLDPDKAVGAHLLDDSDDENNKGLSRPYSDYNQYNSGNKRIP